MRRLALESLAVFALLLCAPSHARANGKPIVAVFSVEAKGIALDVSMLDRLSDYLAGSLAATGQYQVVPRSQLKQRLVQQKAASYRNCYDRSCQIEIGKELAAQKSLATQVIKLGTKCAITGTLFDLRRAAAERAATARGGCSEDEIVSSLETMVKKLAPQNTFRVIGVLGKKGGASVRRRSKRREFAVDFRSHPPGANVFLDGRSICTTDCRSNLHAGSYELQLERNNRLVHTERVTVNGREVFDVKLKLSPAGREAFAQRTEILNFEGLVGFITDTADGGLVGGGVLQVVTIKWKTFFLSVVEVALFGGGENFGGFLSMRGGFPLYYGDRGQHQLRFGLGVGGGGFEVDKDSDSNSSAAFVLSPTVEYRYMSSGWLNFGVGARALLPLGDFAKQPFAAFLSLIVGFQTPGYLL